MLKYKVFVFFILYAPLITFSQPDASNGQEQGSQAAIRDTHVRFNDPETGAPSSIFESVLNGENMSKGNYSQLRYYITPIFLFKIEPESVISFVVEDDVIYELPMVFYKPSLYDEAVRRINEGPLKEKYKINDSNVAALPHQMITWSVRNVPSATIEPWGSLGANYDLPNEGWVTVRVPVLHRELFENLLKSHAGVSIEATLHYNALNLLRETVSWTMQDLRNTQTFKDLESGGSNFVRADQVEKIIREVAISKDVYAYQDPGIDSKLIDLIQNVFTKLIDKAEEVEIRSRDEAERIDEQLRAGTGLSPDEFRPLVLIWDLIEEIKDTENYKEANEKVRSFLENNSISRNSGINVGLSYPGVGSLGVDSSTGRIRGSSDSEAFKDEKEYEDFKLRHIRSERQEAHVVAMGVKLLEKGSLLNSLSTNANYLVVQSAATAEKHTRPARASVSGGVELVNFQEKLLSRLKDLEGAKDEHDSKIKSLERKFLSIQKGISGASSKIDGLSNRIDKYYNRSWRNVTESRKLGRDYTNNRPYPIEVSLQTNFINVTTGNKQNRCHARIIVDEELVAEARRNNIDAHFRCFLYTTVPPGERYRIESRGYEIAKDRAWFVWYELY